MITIKEGNLLDATENIIGHQVNCFTMGSGIAKQIIDKYPIILWEFKKFVKNNNINALGKCQFIEIGKNKYIANLFAQYKYGLDKQHTRYDYLLECLCDLKNNAQYYNLSIALPYYIGAGRGGGNINDIHDIIKAAFWDYNVTLYRLN